MTEEIKKIEYYTGASITDLHTSTTNKKRNENEIYIDGVNVAGCVQLQKELTYPCGLGGTCEGWDNCYYKQLQRLKQKNEKLKKANERLKTLYQNEGITDICDSCSITSAMEAYEYHKALEEIKVIAQDTFHCCDDDCGNARKIKLIIDKINEVLQ